LFRIVTLNANGIRSAATKGMFRWIKRVDPDIVCLQEVKAHEVDIPAPLRARTGLHSFFHCAQKKGYSGAALYSKKRPRRVELGFGNAEFDAEGRYVLRTVRPVHYAIPDDGPVGRMLRAANRHPWRPAHIHFVISADGCEPVTTHIFDDSDPYLASDTVFAVKESLICRFIRHDTRDAAAARFGIEPPFDTVEFDFVLAPSRERVP